ncbi:hypothetical protein [Mycobacterium aquaticum]|uniref:Uncharacterized protein n=1 Tax=Mycobacterium aquaticum TaxID=1927124 RepID=A0A1X0B6Y4_9MYCO|nr:hypothetical protein [Mycobacterium aquaticum]ORA38080.1 hypothetical protein BST13_05640 [Mycobacterium aquaticum]
MNTCEDQSEPLGESPDVPARYDAGIGTVLAAIDRGATLGILSAADEVLATKQLAERQGRAINAVRELHTESTYWKNCCECHDSWPCATIRAIDEACA